MATEPEDQNSQPEELSEEQRADVERLSEEWISLLMHSGLQQHDVAEMVRKAAAFEQSAETLADLGPQNEEELDKWFEDRIGVTVPKVSVCPGHVAPFEIACDIHFFREKRILWVASRGGTKTSLMAWLDLCAAESFPHFESWTTGPGLSQGQRKYEHMLPYVVEGGVVGGKELPHIAQSTQTHTIFRNGSKCGIGPGTVAANNGPRAPRLHRDERELMDPAVYKQAGNIPAGRETPDGRYIPAQIIDTSTMKWAHGPVAKELEEFEKALQEGRRPRMTVKVSCIFEITEEQPHCRAAPKDEREARLKELDRDPCELCDCETWTNDVWDNEETSEQQPRTLEDVCSGRFFRSRGFKDFEDIQTLFLENDRYTWDSEQECSEPSKEGVYIKSYSQIRNGIRDYVPDPDNGLIYMGVDWGGEGQHAIAWYQLLDRDIEVQSYAGSKIKLMPQGSLVVFGEIWRAGIGNVDVGQMAVAMEDSWRRQWPSWSVHERYPDYQNAAGRMDWEKHLSLKLTSRIKKDFNEELKYIREWVGKGKLFVDIPKCQWFDNSIRAWHEANGHEADDALNKWSTHHPAQLRYTLHNLQVIGRQKAVAQRASVDVQKMLQTPDSDEKEWDPTEHRQRNIEIVGAGGAEDSPNRKERGSLRGLSFS